MLPLRMLKIFDIHWDADSEVSSDFHFRILSCLYFSFFCQLELRTHLSFRNKNLSQFEYCFPDFYMRTWAFGKCHRKMNTVRKRFRNPTERVHWRGCRASKGCGLQNGIKQCPHLCMLLACVYTSHAELSLAVLTALWNENPPEIK